MKVLYRLKISLFFDYVNVSEPGKTTTDETMILLHWTRIARIRKKRNTAQIKHTQTNNWNQLIFLNASTYYTTQRSAKLMCILTVFRLPDTRHRLELFVRTKYPDIQLFPICSMSLVSLKTTGTGI